MSARVAKTTPPPAKSTSAAMPTTSASMLRPTGSSCHSAATWWPGSTRWRRKVSFQLDPASKRMFVNLSDQPAIAVVDRDSA
jgi:hypothetical protein